MRRDNPWGMGQTDILNRINSAGTNLPMKGGQFVPQGPRRQGGC